MSAFVWHTPLAAAAQLLLPEATPNHGALTGNETIVVAGSGFQSGASVTIDGVPCTSVVVDSSAQITCVTPAGASLGLKALRVTNTGGDFTERLSGFGYVGVNFGSAGAVATGTTSLSIPFPTGIAAGDLLVITTVSKYNAPARPTGWNLAGSASGGAGASGPDSSGVFTVAYLKIADGTESGSQTINISAGNSAIGRMFRYTKPNGSATGWHAYTSGGSDNTAGTHFLVSATIAPTFEAGDMVLSAAGTNTDANTYSSPSVAVVGVHTWGTTRVRQSSSASDGDDCSLVVSEHQVLDGSSAIAMPTFEMIASASAGNENAGAALLICIRAVTLTTPADRVWSGYWRTPFAGAPWQAQASAGQSGFANQLLGAPVAVDEYAVLDGIDDIFTGGVSIANSVGNTALLGTTSGALTSPTGTVVGLHSVVSFASEPAPSGTPANDPCIWRNNSATAAIGLTATSSGLSAYIVEGGVTYYSTPTTDPSILPADDTWFSWRIRISGTTLGLTVNNGPEQTVTFSATLALTATPLVCGSSADGDFVEMNQRELGFTRAVMSSGEWISYGQYLEEEYTLDLGFSLNIGPAGDIATGEVVPSPDVSLNVSSPASIASSEAVPSPQLNLNVSSPASIASEEAVGAPQVDQTIAEASGVASTEAVPDPTVTATGAITDAGDIPSSEAVGAPRLDENVSAAGDIASTEAVGTPQLNENIADVGDIASTEVVAAPQLNENVSDAGDIASAALVPSPVLDLSVAQTAGISSEEAIGSPQLDENVGPAGDVVSAEAVSSPTVAAGAVTVSQTTGIDSAEAVDSPQLGMNVGPAGGVASAESVSTVTVSPGSVTVSPSSVASEESVSMPFLGTILEVVSIASAESVPEPFLVPGAVEIGPAGNIASIEVVPSPTVQPGAQYLGPAGNIVSEESVPSVWLSLSVFGVGDIISLEVVPPPEVASGGSIEDAGGIASMEVVPQPFIALFLQEIFEAGNVASAESVGTPSLLLAVLPGVVVLPVPGPSGGAHAFGVHRLSGVARAIGPFSRARTPDNLVVSVPRGHSLPRITSTPGTSAPSEPDEVGGPIVVIRRRPLPKGT